jgi:hypothetical protein
MTNCLPEDSRRGYQLFRSLVDADLAAINEKLLAEGRHPVSFRTFRSYKTHANLGLVEFTSVNQADVAKKLGLLGHGGAAA